MHFQRHSTNLLENKLPLWYYRYLVQGFLKPLSKIYGFFFFFYYLPGTRFDDGAGGDNEVQRTMLELINQLDGFDPRGNIKVLMATNR